MAHQSEERVFRRPKRIMVRIPSRQSANEGAFPVRSGSICFTEFVPGDALVKIARTCSDILKPSALVALSATCHYLRTVCQPAAAELQHDFAAVRVLCMKCGVTLCDLSLGGTGGTEINWNNRQLSDADSVVFCTVLRSGAMGRSLTKVTLSGNRIGDAGVAALGRVIGEGFLSNTLEVVSSK